MRALLFEQFAGPLAVREVSDPAPAPDGAVVEVGATGICRSDWHAWQGHDPGVALPHVGGHELAGTVVAVGADVRDWNPGARVTVPFVCACGRCAQCAAGHHQVCENQTQPGFTHWGSFAQLVALDAADVNLVALPDEMSFTTAAALGCRYATAFRAVVQQGRARAGERVAVIGCGGVGLSAVQIAADSGANVVAVDVNPAALELATAAGAQVTVDARNLDAGEIAAAVGGADLSLDALGSVLTCEASLLALNPRGRHVQVGLLPPQQGRPVVPMDRVIAYELEVLGSHGMAAHGYPELLELVLAGRLRPQDLVTRTIALDDAAQALAHVGEVAGITVVDRF